MTDRRNFWTGLILPTLRDILAIVGAFFIILAALYACDSDRNPKGQDAAERLGAKHGSAGRNGIAQGQPS